MNDVATTDIISLFFFFFNDTATTEIYTLSLHDALPICSWRSPVSSSAWPTVRAPCAGCAARPSSRCGAARARDRKSTRLNSSHANISYAVFCLKKKKNTSYILPTALRFEYITQTHLLHP